MTRIVEIVKQVQTNLANRFKTILTNIQNIIRTPIIDALKQITDTLVAPSIKSLQKSYEDIIARVQSAIDQLQASANAQFAAYLQYLTDLSADGVNLVTGLAAGLNSLLENAIGNNVVQCTIQFGSVIQEYATNFIPTYAECVEEASVNATNLIDSALTVAEKTLGEAEELIQEFRDCIAPTLADPKNFNKKITAAACLANLVDTAIVDGTVLVNTVNSSASELVDALVLAASDVLSCVNFKNAEAIVGAFFIEEGIKNCLA